jgi:F0F1-type ATP synthase epsilon subunit
MANKFDSTNYPTTEPNELQLGDFWAWKKTDLSDDYPTADYSLSYEFNIIDGAAAVNFTLSASESNNEYIIETTDTSSYTKGEYNWVSYITRTSDSARIKISEGFTEIQDNYATTTTSVRSHAKKVLDAIEAVIENRATMDQSSMSIAGRSLSRLTIDELLTFRNRYKSEYLKEIKKARLKNNKASGNSIKARF